MPEFLTRHKVALTPLSPIHIGCGEDFEPTNYIIDATQKLLYGFDPSGAVLDDKFAAQLQRLGESGNLLGIQKFFIERKELFKPLARVLLPVAQGVASDYDKGIGKAANVESDGKKVFNQFTIERHSHSRNVAYVPGSSLKGALRTAWMDRLNDKRRVTDKDEKKNSAVLAKRLLQGDFSTSPLRLLKVGDLMPAANIASEVLYAVNRYKIPKTDARKSPRGVTTRKQCIAHGQYRVLSGEISVQDLQGKGDSKETPKLRAGLLQIAKDSNAYHLPRLQAELTGMAKANYISATWKKSIETLLNAAPMKQRLDSGRAMLVRLGRYGGAESKTLTQAAEIKIMGKQGQPPKFLPQTTTYWLAAPQADAHVSLLPFGWAILEIDPQDDITELRTWCDAESKQRPDMQTHYANVQTLKAQAEQQREQRKAEDLARQQAEAAEANAAAQRDAALAAMTPNLRRIEEFKTKCANRIQQLNGGKDKPNTSLHQEAAQLAKSASEGADWTTEEKCATADAIEEWLPKTVAVELKDVRKKLGLAALREP